MGQGVNSPAPSFHVVLYSPPFRAGRRDGGIGEEKTGNGVRHDFKQKVGSTNRRADFLFNDY